MAKTCGWDRYRKPEKDLPIFWAAFMGRMAKIFVSRAVACVSNPFECLKTAENHHAESNDRSFNSNVRIRMPENS
jgi:hypothetical protein